MAGILPEVTNNLLGLQALAQGRQQLEERQMQMQNQKEASESLRRYYASESTGRPDYDALNDAFLKSPDLAGKMLQGAGIVDARRGRAAADYAVQAYGSIDNPEQFVRLTQDRIKYLRENGRDPSNSEQVLQEYLTGDREKVRQGTKMLAASLTNQGYLQKDVYDSVFGMGGMTAEMREFNSLTQNLSPEEAERARRIKLGLNPRAVGSSDITIADEGLTDMVGDSKSDIAGKVKGAETTSKGVASRQQDFINRGVAAAEGVPVVKRALTLLDAVGTGGFDRAAIQARQMFGIESADEGELSYNLGKSVLTQLRETFGAAFTQEEGKRLEKLEAGLGRNPESNKRILNQTLTLMMAKASRGKKAALEKGDDFTAADIDNFLTMSLDPETMGQSTAAPTANASAPAAQQAAPRFTGQDQQAYEWAQSNPNDPRAAAILRRLGVQ